MSLDVKVLFGNLSLVNAPAFSSRTKVLWMAGYSPPVINAFENGTAEVIRYNPSKLD